MSTFAPAKIVYPESDGKPMADNTKQYECITTLHAGLDELIPDFVGANNFWYPVEGQPRITTAPDVYVALGRPKGHRPSYMQWEEGGVAPQVVFEVMSPSNNAKEMARKRTFYAQHGVDEFYIYDPDDGSWQGYVRGGGTLNPVADMATWVSPHTGIRFDPAADEMRVLGPDGKEFETIAESKRLRRDAERALFDAERARIEAERARFEADERVDRLREKLRAAGIDPDA